MLATQQQKDYIAFKIYKLQDDYKWMNELMESISRGEIDDRQIKISNMLDGITDKQADYWLKAYSGAKGYSRMTAREILNKFIKLN